MGPIRCCKSKDRNKETKNKLLDSSNSPKLERDLEKDVGIKLEEIEEEKEKARKKTLIKVFGKSGQNIKLTKIPLHTL